MHCIDETSVRSYATEVSRALVLLLLLSGCGSPGAGPPSEHANRYRGSFESTCSPVDATAISFNLTPKDGAARPQVEITIWADRVPAAGQRIQLGFDGAGYAAAFISGTEWTQTTDGEIGLDEYAAGDGARGWFWLELSDGQRLEGWFEAGWIDRGPVFCG